MKNKIIVALDVDSPIAAQKLYKILAPHVGGFKFGPRLTFRCDRSFLRDVSESGILFFDHKFFDIPSTTVAAVNSAAELGAHWVTVHALNGPECLKKVAELETTLRLTNPFFRAVAVTVLTSFSEKNLPPIWKNQSLDESVTSLAHSAFESGLHTIVCSPQEIKLLKKINKEVFLITPGIRTEGSPKGDQARVATPSEAIHLGADAIVIGRSVTECSDPVASIKEIIKSL
jgi:orotidine-5'-phosphate decarboxylase